MEQYMWIIWLSLFVLMIIIEASGPALISIWFAFGALISLIVSVIPGAPWWSELIIFIVISISTLLALRPIFKRYLKRNTVRTNVDSFIGKMASVIMGSTETTLYTIAIYTGCVKIKNTRGILLAALIGDVVGIIVSIIICRFMW